MIMSLVRLFVKLIVLEPNNYIESYCLLQNGYVRFWRVESQFIWFANDNKLKREIIITAITMYVTSIFTSSYQTNIWSTIPNEHGFSEGQWINRPITTRLYTTLKYLYMQMLQLSWRPKCTTFLIKWSRFCNFLNYSQPRKQQLNPLLCTKLKAS